MAIQRFKYKSYEEFLAIRRELQGVGKKDVFRLGASDVATVYSNGEKIGLNEYSSPTVFFYRCCEFAPQDVAPTLEMFRGSTQEALIYERYWKYFSPEHPTKEFFLENVTGPKQIFRKATKVHHTIMNDKYPWLFASLDYYIQKNPYTKRGPLELKSPSSRANEKYEAGIATSYVIQVHNQMMLTQSDYCELFAVVDATYPELYPFNENTGIQKNIIESSKDFVDRVLAGKKIVYSNKSQLQKEQLLAKLAPDDHGNPLYTDYLKEKHKPENAKATVQGTGDQLELVCSYLRQKALIKSMTENSEDCLLEKENKIREFFQGDVGYVEWPDLGKISWVDRLNIPKKILERVDGGI